jgi:protein phosphatase 1 regulatory subunit 37
MASGDTDPDVTKAANSVLKQLQKLIQSSAVNNSSKLEELLDLNDSLRGLLATPSPSPSISSISPKLGKTKGFGLGISIPLANGDGHEMKITTSPHSMHNDDDTPLAELQPPNSASINRHTSSTGLKRDDMEDEEVVSTPRLDKGKGRAEPEPERPAPVLRRPSFVLDDEEEEDSSVVVPEVTPDVVSPIMDR